MYQPVRFASSLVAALLDGLFEHPVVVQAAMPLRASLAAFFSFTEFFHSLLRSRIDHPSAPNQYRHTI